MNFDRAGLIENPARTSSAYVVSSKSMRRGFCRITSPGILLRNRGNFFDQTAFQRLGFQPKADEAVIGDVQFIFCGFIARIVEIGDFCTRCAADHFGKITHAVGFGHLVQNIHAFARLRRVV